MSTQPDDWEPPERLPDEITDPDTCRCGGPAAAPATCPLRVELAEDEDLAEARCTCCDDCRSYCAADV